MSRAAPRPWSDGELATLRIFWPSLVKGETLARALNRSRGSMERAARERLGLPPRLLARARNGLPMRLPTR